jgi:hypothetical protein
VAAPKTPGSHEAEEGEEEEVSPLEDLMREHGVLKTYELDTFTPT